MSSVSCRPARSVRGTNVIRKGFTDLSQCSPVRVDVHCVEVKKKPCQLESMTWAIRRHLLIMPELVVSHHLELDPGAPWGCGAEQFANTNRHSPGQLWSCSYLEICGVKSLLLFIHCMFLKSRDRCTFFELHRSKRIRQLFLYPTFQDTCSIIVFVADLE